MEQKKEDIFDRMMHLHLFRIFEPFYQKNKEMLLYLLFGGLTTFHFDAYTIRYNQCRSICIYHCL